MITALLAASLSLSTPAHLNFQPQRPAARPALWVVNDHDTIIYLFGTFHALDGSGEWFNHEVRGALGASDELVLETLIPNPPALQPQAPATPRTMAPVAGSASFLSTGRMVMSAGRSRGMSIDKGADSVLRNAAEYAGKRVGGLESFDFQIAMLSGLKPSSAPGVQAPAPTPQNAAAAADALAAMQEAWKRGEAEVFAPMLERLRDSSPDSYKAMFPDRNARWAAWIAGRLNRPGTVFVAVGAGHLAGRDSVQHKLAQLRVRTERIN